MLSDSIAPITVDQLAAEQSPEPQSAPKTAWHSPTLIRIDIKRTLCGTGSIVDSNVAASSLSC
jgi:hypothetical protein